MKVVVSFYEAANTVIIEFDMDNSILGLPRPFVVASAGEHVELINILKLVVYLFTVCCDVFQSVLVVYCSS